jgi:phosphate transport system protein
MVRINFEEELQTAENSLIAQAAMVHTQLGRVMDALDRRDIAQAMSVVAEDDRVDDVYLATQTRILNLLALQAPVAKDLRLVSAILHSNMHVERMGDLCVNIAKFVTNDHPYPTSAPMLGRLDEMGERAGEMLQTAMRAFTDRNVDLAEELPERDGVLNRLNRGMLGDLRDYAGDEESFEWAVNLILVARYLERFGDHAVDIGEQTHFLVTGVFREFTDASHPELRPQGG